MLILAVACEKDIQSEVNALTMDTNELSIVEGESKLLTLSVIPQDAVDKTIEWSSSDKTVATVINGKVNALKEGESNITATSKNGITAVCKITVAKKIIALIDLKFESENYSISVSESQELKLVFDPLDANSLDLVWKSSNEEYLTVDKNGVITGIAIDSNNDDTNVKVTATSSNGKIAECSVKVSLSSANVFIGRNFIFGLNDNAITLPESEQTEMEKKISIFLKELKKSMPFDAYLYLVTNYSDYNDPTKNLGNGLLIFSEMASDNIFIPMTIKKESFDEIKIVFEGAAIYNIEESVANKILTNEKFINLQDALEDTKGLTVKYDKYSSNVEIMTLTSKTNPDLFWHFFNEIW